MAYAADKAAVLALYTPWIGWMKDAQVSPGRATLGERLFACYYDSLYWAIKMKAAGLLNSTLADQIIANYRTTHREEYIRNTNTAAGGANYNPSVPYMTTNGYAEDYLVNGDTTSKSVIGTICTTSGYIISSGTTAKYTEIHYARELAYAMQAIINNYRVGNVTLASISTQLATFKSNCFTLMTNWQNGTATLTQFYIRPFMVALVIDALILYHEKVAALTTAEKNAINAMVTYIDANLWRSGDTYPSLKFTSVRIDAMSRTVPPTEEQAGLWDQNQEAENQDGTGKDVELMFNMCRAWCYKEGYGAAHKTRFDLALTNNYPHYTGAFIDYGAYIGSYSLAGCNAKHISQQFWRTKEAFEWREAGDLLGTGSSSGATVAQQYVTGQGGYYGGTATVAASFDPATYFSGATTQFDIDGNNTPKILDPSDVAVVNTAKIKTINSTAGTVSWVQATGANQATYNTGVANSKGAIVSTGSPITYAPSGTTAQNICRNTTKWAAVLVWIPVSTGANAMFLRCYDSSFSFNRIRLFLSGNQLAIEGQKADSTASTTLTATQTITTGTVNMAVWQWDVAAGTATADLNGAATSIAGTAFSGGAGTIANTASASQELFTTTDGKILRFTVLSGALASDLAGLRAGAKSYYAITVY